MSEHLAAFMRDCRLARGLTRSQLADELRVSSSEISRWERGYGTPPAATLDGFATILNLSDDERGRLSVFAGQHGLAGVNAHEQATDGRAAGDGPIREIKVQIADLREAIESIGVRIDKNRSGDADLPVEAEAFEDLKKLVVELQASSQQLRAPVILPSAKQMEVKLIPSLSFDRLQEYRQEENKWSSLAMLFLGAVMGMVTNLATGGTPSPGFGIVATVLLFCAGVMGASAWAQRRRAIRITAEISHDVATPEKAAPENDGRPTLV
jgi:transcriptional regulator with XRE-family HTH domain